MMSHAFSMYMHQIFLYIYNETKNILKTRKLKKSFLKFIVFYMQNGMRYIHWFRIIKCKHRKKNYIVFVLQEKNEKGF